MRINNKIIPLNLGFRTATYKLQVTSKLTDMYDLVPTKEFAMESISCPLTPKSHSLISPREFTRMFDGFTSVKKIKMPQFACNKFIELLPNTTNKHCKNPFHALYKKGNIKLCWWKSIYGADEAKTLSIIHHELSDSIKL